MWYAAFDNNEMEWCLLIEFGVGEKAIVLDTGLNIKKFGDVIDEEN